MSENRIALCNGFTAYFNEDENAYLCQVPWLGREITVRLSGCDYDDNEIADLKRVFERFWTDRDSLLKKSQVDIKKKLLPLIKEKKKTEKYCSFPDLSEDDFDADYWLTLVQIFPGPSGDEVHFFFNQYDDKEHYNEIYIERELDSKHLTFGVYIWIFDVE